MNMNKVLRLRTAKYGFILLLFSFAVQNIGAVNDPKYPYHPATNLSFTTSSLPIVIINLDAVMANKGEDRRISASMKVIWNRSGGINSVNDTENIDYEGKIGIKYRGNSSYQLSDKKPFSVRTEDGNGSKKKESILGMGKDEDWAFLAPFSDKSLIRDMLTFNLMQGTFDYTPSGRYCELVLNNVYQGIYIVTARVRQGSNRVDLKKPTADDGVGVTGGYLLEIDRNDAPGFYSNRNVKDLRENDINLKPYFNYKYPDEEDMTPAQINYIKNQVKAMENAVAGNDFRNVQTGYRNYIDVGSIINFMITQELTKNVDGYRLSTPMYKYSDDIDKRFKFSIWDFNISMGNADYMHGWSTEGWVFNNNRFSEGNLVPWFFKRLLQDETFYSNLKETWAEYRTLRLSNENILATIDSLTAHLNEAQVRNFTVWPRFGQYVWPNYYIASSWTDEITYLKNWLLKRIDWIDSQWLENFPNLVPNPGMEAAPLKRNGDASLSEWTTSGNVSLSNQNKHSGTFAMSIRSNSTANQVITELIPGLYTFKAWVKTQGDPGASLYLKYHRNRAGTDQIRETIEADRNYYLIEINNIEVTNNFMEIGFVTQNNPGDLRLWVDDIELKRQMNPSEIVSVGKDENAVQLFTDRDALTLTISINSQLLRNYPEIAVYDLMGNKIYATRMNTSSITIKNRFIRHQVYFVKIGTINKKIIF
jgi:hypothetical protein